MVDFAGWEMPVQYRGIIAEHLACRATAAIFDVSHMGEVKLRGRDALASVQRIATNDASKLVDGRVQYAALCTESGGIVDDATVYRRGPEDYCLVVNASNAEKDVAWIRRHAVGDTRVEDVSAATALIAVQGPKAPAIVQRVADRELLDLPRYWFRDGAVSTPGGAIATFSRTGYTGEDGFEIACLGRREVWDRLMESGRADGWSRRGSARGTRCAWRRRCACTGTNSRRRPVRSRRESAGPWRSTGPPREISSGARRCDARRPRGCAAGSWVSRSRARASRARDTRSSSTAIPRAW
jgi:glycine cleavage system aminomethyltransferase T